MSILYPWFFFDLEVERGLIRPRGNPIARTIIGSVAAAMEFRRILLTGAHTNTRVALRPTHMHTHTHSRTNYAVRVSAVFFFL